MSTLEKQKIADLRKKLSIELCDNFMRRLNPLQSKETKLGALIAIRNFIKESRIDDPILLSCLVDTIVDQNKEVRNTVSSVIKDVIADKAILQEIRELLEIKLNESDSEIKKEITGLLKAIS